MVQFKAIRHVKTYMEVVEQITEMIRRHELLPGDKLPAERQLSVELGIGRQCLREALSVLEVLGFTEVRKGRGTYVSEDVAARLESKELDVEEAGDPFALMDARKVIECRTAYLAAQMASPEDISRLEDILSQMKILVECGEHGGQEDKSLHLTIARASRNPVFLKIMNDIIANMGKKLWLTLKERSLLVEGRNERYYEEHIKLVNAIKQGDSRLAEKIMLQHLTGIEQDLCC